MLLLNNKPQHNDMMQNKLMEKEKQNLKKKKTWKNNQQVGLQDIPTYKILNKIILKTPKAKIPKRKFSLLSNTLLVFFRRILKG